MNLCELYVIEGEAENKEEAIKLKSDNFLPVGIMIFKDLKSPLLNLG